MNRENESLRNEKKTRSKRMASKPRKKEQTGEKGLSPSLKQNQKRTLVILKEGSKNTLAK